MIEAVRENLGEIATLCRSYGVKRLELIGSAARGDFDPHSSDIDFLISFEEAYLGPWLSRYFDLEEELAHLLGREVDLVMEGALRNPYLIESIEEDRQPVYDSQAETRETGGRHGRHLGSR